MLNLQQLTKFEDFFKVINNFKSIIINFTIICCNLYKTIQELKKKKNEVQGTVGRNSAELITE